jgi:tRNA dimethylallyltransferase
MSPKAINLNKPKVLVLLGPTAVGKTALGVRLAWKYQGEIVSADSRQVYQGMDIGTGKDLAEYKVGRKHIPYHLIDVISPNTEFNLAQYQKLALEAISDIINRGQLPIIVGGTGLYLQALVDNYDLSKISPDLEKRRELEALTKDELFGRLKKLKPEFALKLNNSDKNNPRRLVRYLEIVEKDGDLSNKQDSPYDFLVLGLDFPDDILRERINKRIKNRLEKEDMLSEVERLHNSGVSWERLISFGLEYKFLSYYLLGRLDYDEMVQKLGDASYRFAKRQKTWFKRWERQGRKIHWLSGQSEAEVLSEAEALIDNYL